MDSEKVATGGTVKRVGLTSRLVHTFTKSGTFTVHRPTLIRYLVVGGRGGGPTKDVGKPAVEGTKLNTVDQEGGVGEVVEGTSTYKLQPGTYTVTVGPRSTEFTTKQIVGFGVNSGQYLGTLSDGSHLYRNLNKRVGWTGSQRTYTNGAPSSIQAITTAKGGPPHPGIWTKPAQSHIYKPITHKFKNHDYSTITRAHVRADVTHWDGIDGLGYAKCVIGKPFHQPGPGNRSMHCNLSQRSEDILYTMNTADRTWKSIGNPNTAAQKDSDITGQTVKYGLTPMVIITYDESQAGPVPTTAPPTTTPPPGPSQEEIDRVVKEYEAKMAQLQAAAAAEKQALIDQNSAAAQQAQQLQQQLTGDLTALKQQYDQLKTAAETTTGQLDQAKQELGQLKSEYAQKMAALQAAQAAELEALNAKNSAAVNEARAAQQQLIAEMTSLKSQYDAIVAKASECPTIPENAIVVDGKDGQLYKWQMAALRPMSSDTYRALGSPGYTTFPSGQLDRCPRGPVVVIETPPPTTPTPTSSPKDQTFPGTLYILVHAESWLKEQELKVLASRFGGATIEPFQYKSLEQVFVINNNGYIRNLEGNGPYLASHDSCMAPVMMKETPEMGWKIQKAGDSKYAYRLVAHCGTSLTASIGAREPMLERPSTEQASDTWYILPVGSATF